jgi:Uma2 family endonuclease
MQATAAVQFHPERSYELVDGEWKEKEMPGGMHGLVSSRLDRRIGAFAEEHNLGETYVETSFQIGGNERIPDVAYVSVARTPAENVPRGKWPVPPDIAIEVISPNDLYPEVQKKMEEYLAAGVHQVWHVEPERRTITIYRSPTNIIAFPEDSELTCEDLLPGFRCALRDVFKAPAGSFTN